MPEYLLWFGSGLLLGLLLGMLWKLWRRRGKNAHIVVTSHRITHYDAEKSLVTVAEPFVVPSAAAVVEINKKETDGKE